MDIMAGVCLLIQGVWDIRIKQIPLWVSLCFGGCSILYSICNQRSWISMCMALIPGILCILIGYCTRQAVGYGDGILLCALGLLYSLEKILEICMIATALGGVVGLVLLIIFKKKGSYEIPFVPFLFVGWLFETIETLVGGTYL